MTAFSWLKEAATVNICTLSEDPSLGLALSADDATVKCYLADTGLLSTMAFSASAAKDMPAVYRQVLLGDASVNEGMLTENAVAQQLAAAGHGLYFYANSSRETAERMEIDFLVVSPFPDAAMKPRVSPIEVKSGKRVTFTSLDKFRAKFAKRVGTDFVVWDKPAKIQDDRRFIPLYMAYLL